MPGKVNCNIKSFCVADIVLRLIHGMSKLATYVVNQTIRCAFGRKLLAIHCCDIWAEVIFPVFFVTASCSVFFFLQKCEALLGFCSVLFCIAAEKPLNCVRQNSIVSFQTRRDSFMNLNVIETRNVLLGSLYSLLQYIRNVLSRDTSATYQIKPSLLQISHL